MYTCHDESQTQNVFQFPWPRACTVPRVAYNALSNGMTALTSSLFATVSRRADLTRID